MLPPSPRRALPSVALPLVVAALLPHVAAAQAADPPAALTAPSPGCASCAEWNAPQRPFRLHGDSWYVGTRGLSAILLTSPQGHVLIDAGLPESAPLVLANIRALGFRPEDVKLLLNSHAHFDHAGGLAAVQHVSGAAVAARAPSAGVLATGLSGRDDPQYGALPRFPALRDVRVVADGEVVRVGPLALTAHATGGHTPGGTSWSWRSCEGARCLDLVYADSQTPVSADGFAFTRSATYPTALQEFARGQARLEGLRCDVLLTPHPAASSLWERVEGRPTTAGGAAPTLVDAAGCRRYAAAARAQLARRVAEEARAR